MPQDQTEAPLALYIHSLEARIERLERLIVAAGLASAPGQPKVKMADQVMVTALSEAMTAILGAAYPADDLSQKARNCRKEAEIHRAHPAAADAVWAVRNAPEIYDQMGDLFDRAAACRRRTFWKGEAGHAQ